MKDYNFKIKIADLLQDSSHTDTIQFTDKFSTLLPESQEGIQATISFHGGDDRTILFRIDTASVAFSSPCDRCGREVHKKLYIEDIEGKGYLGFTEQDDDGSTIPINPKDGLIDIEDFLVHSLILTDDLSTFCEDCEKNTENEIDDEGYEIGNSSTIQRH